LTPFRLSEKSLLHKSAPCLFSVHILLGKQWRDFTLHATKTRRQTALEAQDPGFLREL
jgi:hypothetical protein